MVRALLITELWPPALQQPAQPPSHKFCSHWPTTVRIQLRTAACQPLTRSPNSRPSREHAPQSGQWAPTPVWPPPAPWMILGISWAVPLVRLSPSVGALQMLTFAEEALRKRPLSVLAGLSSQYFHRLHSGFLHKVTLSSRMQTHMPVFPLTHLLPPWDLLCWVLLTFPSQASESSSHLPMHFLPWVLPHKFTMPPVPPLILIY